MFNMMAGRRSEERTLEFFGLLSLPRTPRKKQAGSRSEMATAEALRGKLARAKSQKAR